MAGSIHSDISQGLGWPEWSSPEIPGDDSAAPATFERTRPHRSTSNLSEVPLGLREQVRYLFLKAQQELARQHEQVARLVFDHAEADRFRWSSERTMEKEPSLHLETGYELPPKKSIEMLDSCFSAYELPIPAKKSIEMSDSRSSGRLEELLRQYSPEGSSSSADRHGSAQRTATTLEPPERRPGGRAAQLRHECPAPPVPMLSLPREHEKPAVMMLNGEEGQGEIIVPQLCSEVTGVNEALSSSASFPSIVLQHDFSVLQRDETMMTHWKTEESELSNAHFENFEVLSKWRREYKPLAAKLGRGPKHHTRSIDLDENDELEFTRMTKVMSVSSILWGKRKAKRFLNSRLLMSRLIMRPNSLQRRFWDVSSVFMVLYDIIEIPFGFFEPPASLFLEVMRWFTRIFWTIDMFLSFLTGFMKADGSTVELAPRKIARRYLRTWFLVDFLINVADWLEASRTFRILRMTRLLRVLRLPDVFHSILERFQSERLVIVLGMVKNIVYIVATAHIIACFWFGIGNTGGRDTWVRVYDFQRQSLGYQYTSSFMWSLLLFAGGTDELVPQNTIERVYTIFVFLIAFVMATVFVSSLTSSMTQLHMLASQASQRLSVLRRYLLQNGVSANLMLRVLRNAQHAVSEQKRMMPETSVELLKLVSEPLRVELHFELYCPVLSVHPYFSNYVDECPQVCKKICHMAMSVLLVSKGDVIFNAGEIPAQPKMYIVCSGELSYRHLDGQESDLVQGNWVSEASLWTPWMHQGSLMAETECRLCVLDAKTFQDIAGDFDHTDFQYNPKLYASQFVAELNRGGQDISDVSQVVAFHIMDLAFWNGSHSATQFNSHSPRPGNRPSLGSTNAEDGDVSSHGSFLSQPRKASVLMTPLSSTGYSHSDGLGQEKSPKASSSGRWMGDTDIVTDAPRSKSRRESLLFTTPVMSVAE